MEKLLININNTIERKVQSYSELGCVILTQTLTRPSHISITSMLSMVYGREVFYRLQAKIAIYSNTVFKD